MTPSELEAMVRNLNTRTTAIEQILQTLATNDARPLFEDLKSRFEILAQHLANVPTDITRLTEQGANMKDDIRLLTASLARVSQDLGAKIDRLAQKIDGSPRRRR